MSFTPLSCTSHVKCFTNAPKIEYQTLSALCHNALRSDQWLSVISDQYSIQAATEIVNWSHTMSECVKHSIQPSIVLEDSFSKDIVSQFIE